jgi:uncharacterized repeat protein (TIGR01451 family)
MSRTCPINTILIGFVVLLSVVAPSKFVETAVSGKDWPQLAGGPSHTGFTRDATFAQLAASEGQLQLKWKFALEERVEITTQPIVADEQVFLGLMDGRVIAIEAGSGVLLWTKEVDGAISNTLAYKKGILFFGAENGLVYALDATKGHEIWHHPTNGPIQSSAAILDNTVYIGSSDGYLYALDAVTGQQRWRFHAAGPILTSPAIGNGRIYFGAERANTDSTTPSPVAYAIDTEGNEIWSRPLTGLSLRRTYPILDEGSDTVIFVTLHPGQWSYGPIDNLDEFSPFDESCNSQETESPANLITGWKEYYQTYPERRALFFLDASNGNDKWNPTQNLFPALPPPPYWGVILPVLDDQHRVWFPTAGACNSSLEHDWRLWRIDLLTGQAEQVATQNQFTLRSDEVGRPTLVGAEGSYRFYYTIDADLGIYAPGSGTWYLFGRDGFYNHNYPLDFPPTLHFLRYAGAWLAGNVPSPSPPVIANGTLYFTTFGWLYALQPGDNLIHEPEPPSTSPPRSDSPPIAEPIPAIHPQLGDGSPAAVRAVLQAQVSELIAHGSPVPSAKLYGWKNSALYAYWYPPEALYALAQTLPYLDEPLRSQTTSYLQSQAKTLLYNPGESQYEKRCIVYGQPGIQVGDNNCSSGIRVSWLQNDPNLIAWRLVAMHEIASQTGDWSAVENHWSFIRDLFYTRENGLSDKFNETLGLSVFDKWRVNSRLYLHLQIMAADAVAEMANHMDDATTYERASDIRSQMFQTRLRHGQHVASLYDTGQLAPLPYPVNDAGTFDMELYFLDDPNIVYSLMPYEITVNRDTDVRQVMWEDTSETVYEPTGIYRSWAEMYAYRPLDQEIADWLRDNLWEETIRYLRTLEFRNPWWYWGYTAPNLMGLGEELYASPHLSFSIFQVEARVLQGESLFGDQPAHDYDWLVRHLPWPYGQPAWRDIYHLQNLVALLEVAEKLSTTSDLSSSLKRVMPPFAKQGERVHYTVNVIRTGNPLTTTVRLTDTLPGGLEYVSGSAIASRGEPHYKEGQITWSGSLADVTSVQIEYDMIVSTSDSAILLNQAQIAGDPDGPFTRTAIIIANGYSVYLPISLKGYIE